MWSEIDKWGVMFGIVFTALSLMGNVVQHYVRSRNDALIKDRNSLIEKIDKNDSILTKAITDQDIKHSAATKSVDDYNKSVEKRVRVLEAQQVSETKVKDILQERIAPILDDVNELKATVSVGFKEIKEEMRSNQAVSDMNTHQIMRTLSELTGFLKGKGIIRNNNED